MITNTIQSISKIESKAKSEGVKQFNSTLPISIKVLSQSGPLRYLLELGNTKISTKSLKDLEIGAKYWGELNNSGENSISLSNLIKKPRLLQLKKPAMFFDVKVFEELANTPNFKKEFKTLIIENLSKTTTKDDFVFLTNLLIALDENIYIIPYLAQNQYNMFQFKHKKLKKPNKKEVSKIDFYATFSNLGGVKGEIFEIDERLELNIITQFDKTTSILQNAIDEITGFSKITIITNKEIKPLYTYKDRLLEINV